ncbi:MFS transporter [Paraburkholderia caballeronis]|uniref:MFS transporter, ACS family, phthalate transporter n=1 Tax=Paraburkholderia caballeronis TaxID=416943 RepID=A0A1H7KSE6_9BURK|nr:MFS transporter [Paraburkholderia caballeronis]PXW28143.1 ACS family phthalate transporter-like MFS transporter [Paraburkholderia caballeronis]PXX03509.1 ACS family phthalate transporter-like MFS transporter [Paraburkholderia caballeronis]RAK04253.1 ACS family phthalate transporter-like MFS transporter [Paraburkholderia caballeronis]TDV19296.1 ACS family phthalate transporter-like MFS transporter [Paraburkholderia caballeronis]TDV21896.1 ACS family phthalate transporter-like MFS transporter
METTRGALAQDGLSGPLAAHGGHAAVDAEKVFARIAKRLIPFLFLCYVLNYIDRVNISFAHLQFRADIGLTEASYGLGVGVFYIGYVLFEVPSNLLLRRIGPRRTIARIMVLWGLVSVSMMFVRNPTQFYIARIALGIAEAGFFPGIVYYLTSWFPDRHRAKVLSAFVLGIAVAGITGGPVSGWILSHADGWHTLRAWQWLFLLEGVPPVLVGLCALWYLPDSASTATWLSADEKALVARELESHGHANDRRIGHFGAALRDWRVYACAFGYFTITWAGSVLNFWAPSVIRQAGVANPWHIGLVSAVPYFVGAIGMVLVGRHSDATNERRLHFAGCALIAAAGAVLLGTAHASFVPAIAGLALVAIGYLTCTAIFWTIPATFLSGTASAGSIALISSIGQLGSLSAPTAIGALTAATHDISAGSYLAAAVLAFGAVTIAVSMRRLER